MEAGVDEADILISVMEKDEQNVMCSLIGKKLGAKHTIARIRTPEYSNSINLLKEDLGLSMAINPEQLTANKIARALSIPSALEETTFLKGKIQMISIKVKEGSVLEGSTVSALSKKITGVIVCTIERDNVTSFSSFTKTLAKYSPSLPTPTITIFTSTTPLLFI